MIMPHAVDMKGPSVQCMDDVGPKGGGSRHDDVDMKSAGKEVTKLVCTCLDEKGKKHDDIAKDLIDKFDGKGKDKEDGELGKRELAKAGLRGDKGEFILEEYAGKDGKLSASELEKALDDDVVTLSRGGDLRLTKEGREEFSDWQTLKVIDEYDGKGKSKEDDALGKRELSKAGLKGDKGEFILDEYAGKDGKLSRSELENAVDDGLVKVKRDGSLGLTKEGKEELKEWKEDRPTNEGDSKAATEAISTTFAKYDQGNGTISEEELRKAGIEDDLHNDFLREYTPGADGKLDMLQLYTAEKNGWIEVSDDGRISMTDEGKELAEKWDAAGRPAGDPYPEAAQPMAASYEAAGRLFAAEDGGEDGATADGLLSDKELQAAGVDNKNARDFITKGIYEVDPGLAKHDGASADAIAGLEAAGFLEIDDEGQITMTEQGQAAIDQWTAAQKQQASVAV